MERQDQDSGGEYPLHLLVCVSSIFVSNLQRTCLIEWKRKTPSPS